MARTKVDKTRFAHLGLQGRLRLNGLFISGVNLNKSINMIKRKKMTSRWHSLHAKSSIVWFSVLEAGKGFIPEIKQNF